MNPEINEDHHRYSPSALEMFEGCPCYERDDTRDTTAADEGTLMHKAAELGDLGILAEPEQVETVQKVLAFQESAIAELAGGDGALVLREQKVDVSDMTRGTLDLVILSGTKAHLIDYKFGRNKVTEADENGQVQAYVVGLFEKFPELEQVKASLVFPRLDWVTTAEYTRADLERIRLRIAAIIARAESPDAVPTPNEKSCLYCGRKASCPAMHAVALKVGEALPMPVQFDPGHLTNPQDMAKALVLSRLVEDWAKQVRRTVTRLVVEDGVVVPGYEVRSRGGSHEITNVHEAIELVESAFSATLVDITQACTLSIPKLTDILAAITEGKTKKEIRESLLGVLNTCTVQNNTVVYLQKKRGITDEEIIQG